jgi:three-Cys-motif partner protein
MAMKIENNSNRENYNLAKHEILKLYWQAWLPIMGRWHGRILYIDGFAGPGKYKGGEDGSPIIVLKSAINHTATITAEVIFLFIEKDLERFQHLQQVLLELKPTVPNNFKYEAVNGTFNEEIRNRLTAVKEQQKHLTPSLFFIDPFGLSNTPYETIAKLLENPRSEVLITFMYEEINRFLSLPQLQQTCDSLFGTSEWRSAEDETSPKERRRLIHDIYRDQLKKAARYVRSFEMVNSANSTDYFLFFASNNLLGLQKIKEAMWRVDKSRGLSFSDFTESMGTLQLFAEEPDYELLKKMIRSRFAGTNGSVEDVEIFVTAETPFLPSHYKTHVLRPMELAGELDVVFAKERRRKGTFPEGTIIGFH